MERAAKDAVRDLTLKLRKTLEAEVERELGRYGIYAERAWIPADKLPRLSEHERDMDRPRIEAGIRREQDAGLKREEAVKAFVRETAYTHMNRLLGLKCMEERSLIQETITTRDIYANRSQRHRDYLDDHPQAHRDADRGLMPMLQEAYAEVSQHIGVLFDTDSDHAIVWPRHTTLDESIGWINDLDGQVARALEVDPAEMPSVYADDTFLGWVYQYFQEEEKDRVFREVRTKKKKIGGYDIVPATSLYTERYMVQFLVENSLGAMWMEMYPESGLCQGWEYFVEDPNLQDEDGTRQKGRDPRPVNEITLLDPACGSGHFLLYAFDLFAEMYEAEAQMGGIWPDKLRIARDILRHNLYGIDIDLRSIQLSALNLYMKGCVYAGVTLAEFRNRQPVTMNLVCADIVLPEGSESEELLTRFKDDPLTQELIRRLWHGLQNARELGSLLKIEEPIDELIERKKAREKGTWFERPVEMWQQWRQDLVTGLGSFIPEAVNIFDVNKRIFGQEAAKGFALIDILTNRYDVVTTNPPYLYSRNMGSSLSKGVKALYPKSSKDLYVAFIDRCRLLTLEHGFTAMITQQSFMFVRSYVHLRRQLLQHSSFRSMAHLGTGAFEDIGGEKVNTTMFVLANRRYSKGVYLDLTSSESKERRLRSVVGGIANEQEGVFTTEQQDFTVIDGWPIVYWIDDETAELFRNLPPLDSQDGNAIATVTNGLFTCNNKRFVRYHWEILNRDKWQPYVKGAEEERWFGDIDNVVLWSEDGQEIRDYRYFSGQSKACPGEEYYFRAGLAFPHIASNGFAARYFPEDCIFDIAGSAAFPHRVDPFYLLGYLNTSLPAHFISLLNPTINVQVGDVRRFPFKLPDSETESRVSKLAGECMQWQRQLQSFRLIDREFGMTAIDYGLHKGKEAKRTPSIFSAFETYLRLEESLQARILLNEVRIESEILRLYKVGKELRNKLRRRGDLCNYRLLRFSDLDYADLLVDETLLEAVHGADSTLIGEDTNTVLREFEKLYVSDGLSFREVSLEMEVHPVTIIALRRKFQLVDASRLRNALEDFVTACINRLCVNDEDGIVPYDQGLANLPILDQLRSEIEALLGLEQAVNTENEIQSVLGKGGLKDWLTTPFFRKHVSQFRRRPILWQFVSPEQHFRILVYYHKLDRDTLPKIRSQYLSPLLIRARTELRRIRQQDSDNMKFVGELEEYIADLEECDRRLESVIQGTVDVELPEWANGPYRNGRGPYDPDLDDGVYVNILPLQAAGLLPIKVV